MSLQSDSVHAAEILERLRERYEPQGEELSSLICMLDSPLFRQLLTLQGSLDELKQISSNRHLTEDDFDFSPAGELLINEALHDSPDGEHQVSAVHAEKLSAELPDDSGYLGPGGAISTHKYNIEFQRAVEKSAQGRDVETIQLTKEENKSLGFSVVGLKSENQGDLGIFVQGIQPEGIADRDGRLHEGDQILAIDGQPLDISHTQAIRILQSARGTVEVVVARGSIPTSDQSGSESTEHPPPAPAENAADMVLNTDWTQIEVIDVINDGSGLGFGIIGGRSTGVVVKTILPGGVADTDGRLRSGDHILQIGDVNVRGMSSEQVASVLRQSGSHVRLVVARAVMEPSNIPIPHAPIIPTNQLDEQLQNLFSADSQENIDLSGLTEDQINRFQTTGEIPPGFLGAVEVYPPPQDMGLDSPEVEMFDVDLIKDTQGLGITIAGYVGGEKSPDELTGIFVKSISENSAAAVDGRILVNDQIVEVDGQSLHGFTNHQAVDVLRNTGQTVHLKLIRYRHGPKYEQLQQYHGRLKQAVDLYNYQKRCRQFSNYNCVN